jgi:hypothetical protein
MPGLTEGGCQCGVVRYAVAAKPLELYVCHCRECRAQPASAFGVSVIYSAAALALTRGATKIWSRPTASGGTLDCHFCADCGTRPWHATPDAPTILVKGGSLDLAGAAHIWTASRMPGVSIPDAAPSFESEPV